MGQTALHHIQKVEPLRHGAHVHDPIGGDGVQIPATLHRLHAAGCGQRVQILFRHAQRGQDIAVHEVGAVIVIVGGVLHVRRGGAQAGQEGHRQRRQHQDGQIPAERVPDLPERVGAQSILMLHHSISSTGVGRSLRSTPATLPFLMWTT